MIMCTSTPHDPMLSDVPEATTPHDQNQNTLKISNSDAKKTHSNPDYGCYVCLILIALFVIYLAHAINKPSHPTFQIKSALVSNFSASLIRSTSSSDIQRAHFTADWEVDFLVKNPNIGLYLSYSPTIASVFYKQEFLSSMTIPPYTTYQRNVATVQVNFSGSGVGRLSDLRVLDIVEEREQGIVRFHFRLMTMLRFGDDRKEHALIVDCNDAMFRFAADSSGELGTLVGKPIECEAKVK